MAQVFINNQELSKMQEEGEIKMEDLYLDEDLLNYQEYFDLIHGLKEELSNNSIFYYLRYMDTTQLIELIEKYYIESLQTIQENHELSDTDIRDYEDLILSVHDNEELELSVDQIVYIHNKLINN